MSTVLITGNTYPVKDAIKALGGRWNADIFQTSGDVNKIPDDIRFPRQWAAFKNREEQPATGTPLETLPFLTKAQVLEFKAANCTTAEHVRDMSDGLAQKFMGIHDIRRRIAVFLEAAAGAAPAERLAGELKKRDDLIATQTQNLKEQGDAIEALRKQIEALSKERQPIGTKK